MAICRSCHNDAISVLGDGWNFSMKPEFNQNKEIKSIQHV